MTVKCLTSKVLLVLAVIWVGAVPARAQLACGYLSPGRQPAKGKSPVAKIPYRPQPGDLIFFTSDSLFSDIIYALALTGAPHHVGIVVALPDGKPAIAEAGAFNMSPVKLIDLPARFRTFEGHIHVRRLITPLAAKNARNLNQFALDQTCKPYAYFRVVLDSTLMRSHGVIGSRLFGCASLDRSSWTCYELCVACAAAAGLLDPNEVKPNTVYVRDLFRNEPAVFETIWQPPALWSLEQAVPR